LIGKINEIAKGEFSARRPDGRFLSTGRSPSLDDRSQACGTPVLAFRCR
jgi:hypothetical protein